MSLPVCSTVCLFDSVRMEKISVVHMNISITPIGLSCCLADSILHLD